MTMSEDRSITNRLKQLPCLFRTQDAEKIAPHTTMFLSRAAKKGLIHRLNRGTYVNSIFHEFPGVEEVGCFLRPPAYVSCEWAVNYHGISLQSPFVCTIVTLSTSVGKKRSIDYQGVAIEFSRISPALFFGFQNHGRFLMASPEKAILDTLHYRKAVPAQDELEMDEVDIDVLIEMGKRFPIKTSRKLSRFLSQL